MLGIHGYDKEVELEGEEGKEERGRQRETNFMSMSLRRLFRNVVSFGSMNACTAKQMMFVLCLLHVLVITVILSPVGPVMEDALLEALVSC